MSHVQEGGSSGLNPETTQSKGDTSDEESDVREERRLRRNRAKQQKRRDKVRAAGNTVESRKRRKVFVEGAAPLKAQALRASGLPHSAPAYEGVREQGRAFRFLNGAPHQRLERLIDGCGYRLWQDNVEKCVNRGLISFMN